MFRCYSFLLLIYLLYLPLLQGNETFEVAQGKYKHPGNRTHFRGGYAAPIEILRETFQGAFGTFQFEARGGDTVEVAFALRPIGGESLRNASTVLSPRWEVTFFPKNDSFATRRYELFSDIDEETQHLYYVIENQRTEIVISHMRRHRNAVTLFIEVKIYEGHEVFLESDWPVTHRFSSQYQPKPPPDFGASTTPGQMLSTLLAPASSEKKTVLPPTLEQLWKKQTDDMALAADTGGEVALLRKKMNQFYERVEKLILERGLDPNVIQHLIFPPEGTPHERQIELIQRNLETLEQFECSDALAEQVPPESGS